MTLAVHTLLGLDGVLPVPQGPGRTPRTGLAARLPGNIASAGPWRGCG